MLTIRNGIDQRVHSDFLVKTSMLLKVFQERITNDCSKPGLYPFNATASASCRAHAKAAATMVPREVVGPSLQLGVFFGISLPERRLCEFEHVSPSMPRGGSGLGRARRAEDSDRSCGDGCCRVAMVRNRWPMCLRAVLPHQLVLAHQRRVCKPSAAERWDWHIWNTCWRAHLRP